MENKKVPFESILLGYFFVFNAIAVLMIFGYDSFIEPMLLANVLVLFFIKLERVARLYVISKYNVNVKLVEKKKT